MAKSCTNNDERFELNRLDESISIEPHNPDWISWYAEEKRVLSQNLRSISPRFEHVGSSVVCGLKSKPIVDIMIGLDSLDLPKQAQKTLETLGYEYFGRLHESQERLFARKRGKRSFNLQIVPHCGKEWQEKIIFRDYLMAHPDEVAVYSAVKDEAVGRGNTALLEYHRYKDQLVKEILVRALIWDCNCR